MTNLIVSIIIIAIIALAVLKIVREKRKGNKCIGCAISGSCDTPQDSQKDVFLAKKIVIKEV